MRILALALAALLAASPVAAQTGQVNTSRLSVASSGASPAVGSVRLGGLGTTGGIEFLFVDANKDVIRRAVARADLPAAIAYEDEGNTFTLNQVFSGDIAVNGGDITSSGPLTERATGNHTLDPTGDVIIAADGLDVLPATGYTYNIGALTNKFLTLHAAELWVETLVAQNTIATIGGRILVGPTTTLTADLAAAATTMQVKHNQMANGDRVYLEANGQLEWIAIASAPSGSGPYTYTITRNLDGSGANNWTAGDAVFNTGTTGKGYIDLYSTSGVLSGTGPTIAFNVRTGSTYNQVATRGAVGNLNGLYGYAADTYGSAFGDPSGPNITMDATNGVRIRNGTTNQLVAAGGSVTLTTGHVTIDVNGVRFDPGTSAFDAQRGYAFNTGDSLPMGTYGWKTGGSQAIGLVNNPGSGVATVSMQAISAFGSGAYADVVSVAGSPTSTTSFNNYNATKHVFYDAFWSGGLLVQHPLLAIVNSGTDPGYPWINSTSAELKINATGASALRLNWDTTGGVIVNNDSYVRGLWMPYTTATYDLGAASQKWRDIYFSEPTTTAALFPLVTNSGRIMAKNNGLNATTTCAGAQRVSSITTEYGIVTSITCS